MATNSTSSTPKFVLTLNDDQLAKVRYLISGTDRSIAEEVAASLNFGIDNRAYRKGYNAKKNQQQKQLPIQLAKANNKVSSLEAEIEKLRQQLNQQK